jgi:hypothetical protein
VISIRDPAQPSKLFMALASTVVLIIFLSDPVGTTTNCVISIRDPAQSSKLFMALASTVVLVILLSDPVGTNGNIFVLSKLLHVLK